MSHNTSDKEQSKRDSRDPSQDASRPNPQDDVKSDVLETALGELMEMSDDELLDSLSSLSKAIDLPDEIAEGSEEANADDEIDEEGSSDAQTIGLKESESSQQDSSEDGAEMDDRIQEDPVTLFLIQHDIVDVNLVSTGLRSWNMEGPLWRAVADVEGVDRERVFAAVAKMAGYPAYTYLDAAPTRELIDELTSHLSSEALCDLLDRGLLPVDLEPLEDDAQYRLMIVTHDPSDNGIKTHLEEAGISGVCLFAPLAQVTDRISTVRGWIDAPFGEELTNDDSYHAAEYDSDEPEQEIHSEEQMDTDEEKPFGYSGDGLSSVGADVVELSGHEERPPDLEGTEEENVLIIPSDEDLEALSAPGSSLSRDRVIRSLLQNELVSQEQVKLGFAEWQASGSKDTLWRFVAAVPGVNREVVYEEAARVYAFKLETIEPGRPDPDFVVLTMETIADEQREELLDLLLLPFEHVLDYKTGAGRMVFVTPDPSNPTVNSLMHELDLGRFELRYASETEITELLDELFPRKNEYLERITSNAQAFDLGTSYEESVDTVNEEELDAEINRSKLINLFEATLVEATRLGASDIHILPNPKRQIEIHFRLDGRLKKWHTEEGISPEAFISVVKDNSVNVDRFERDAAQDGYIQRRIDETLIRFRVSILPIASANQEIRAESIVIRILDDRKVLTELSQLGMLETAMARFDQAIRQPHGMVILTGPTGSGKSTTLVAALHQVVTPEVNILTVEDPVEYIIRGVRQIKLSHKLDLESALRSILRHDPDIVMVGEMRDKQTAELAIKLANTGHLTFSTLHTNDAPAAISRLYKMGVEPFLIAYAINLVVAQRLIRTVCPTCKSVNKTPDAVLMRSLGWTNDEIDKTTIYQANPGSKCKTCSGMGYKGRRAICETLYFTDTVRHLIAESGTDIDEEAIREAGKKDGMLTLMDSGRKLVEMGVTSLEEMLRVTGAE